MIRSADVLAEKLFKNPQLIDDVKSDPTKLSKLADEAKDQVPAYIEV